MGWAKEAMLVREDEINHAAAVLIEHGFLTECENHGEIYDSGEINGSDPEAFDEIWKNRAKHGYQDYTRDNFNAAMQAGWENHCGDGCGYCYKNMRE